MFCRSLRVNFVIILQAFETRCSPPENLQEKWVLLHIKRKRLSDVVGDGSEAVECRARGQAQQPRSRQTMAGFIGGKGAFAA